MTRVKIKIRGQKCKRMEMTIFREILIPKIENVTLNEHLSIGFTIHQFLQ